MTLEYDPETSSVLLINFGGAELKGRCLQVLGEQFGYQATIGTEEKTGEPISNPQSIEDFVKLAVAADLKNRVKQRIKEQLVDGLNNQIDQMFEKATAE